MTEEFKNSINQVIEEKLNNSLKLLYENNKEYMRPYERIVLESFKAFDFESKKFNSALLQEKEDLVGKTDSVYVTLDERDKKARICLSYLVDNRYPNHKKYVKPAYLENCTYGRPYMKELLEAQGITVKCNYADGVMYSNDSYQIEFDATVIVETLEKLDEEVKRRCKTQNFNLN